jgi:hypothetical protein
MWIMQGAYHRVQHLKDASFGEALALLANIKLALEGLKRTNTPTYYEHL